MTTSIRTTITLSLAFLLAVALYLVPIIGNLGTQPAHAARGCFGPAFWQNHGTSKDVTEKYPTNFGGSRGSGTAKIRLTANSVYLHCPNKQRPRKMKPLAIVQCYTIVDYNIFTGGELESIFKQAFHRHFDGVRFTHKTFQPGALRFNTPPAKVTRNDGTRHNCRTIQESLDDRRWYLFRNGVIQWLWAGICLMDNGGTLVSQLSAYQWAKDVIIKAFPS